MKTLKDYMKLKKEDLARMLVAEKEQAISHPHNVTELLEKYKFSKVESFFVITLDTAHKPIRVKKVAAGTANRTMVHPRDIFRTAIEDNAVAIIVAHNHPSGKLEPSSEDIELTDRIKKAGELLSIPLLDHIIFGATDKIYSFLSEGRL